MAGPAISSVIRWPGMRSEYARLPPHRGSTSTKPDQIGVSFSRHRGLVLESAGRAVRRDVAPGAAFVTGPDGLTWTDVADPTDALEIYPDQRVLRRVADECGGVDPGRAGDGRARRRRVRDRVRRRAHVGGGELADVEASTLAHRLAHHLLQRYASGGPAERRAPGTLDGTVVDRIAQYVDATLAGPITLDRLAELAPLSPAHFARAFHATTGVPPHRFVTARRVEAARVRLLASDASVVQVAHAVGFSNVSHFRRVFRREVGMLPGDLRPDRQRTQQERTLPPATDGAIVRP